MVLTVVPICRNSPCSGRPSTSRAMRWARSPLATAPMTRATSTVGRARSLMREFTNSARLAQAADVAHASHAARADGLLPSTGGHVGRLRPAGPAWSGAIAGSESALEISPAPKVRRAEHVLFSNRRGRSISVPLARVYLLL